MSIDRFKHKRKMVAFDLLAKTRRQRLYPGVKERTNQEGRDAALLAWTYAGLPIRMKTNGNKL